MTAMPMPVVLMLTFLSLVPQGGAGEPLPRGALLRLGTKDAKAQGITTVAMSPDSNVIATTSHDGTARLWERASGKPLHRLQRDGKPNTVWGAAFSPDGKSIALAHARDGITLWDVSSGKLQRQIPHGHAVYSVAFTPDGALLTAETGDPEEIVLWEARTGKVARKFERFCPVSRSVAVSPNGRFLAATGKQALHVWDLQEKQLAVGRQGFDFSAAFSPGAVLLALAGDHWINVVDPASGRKLGEFRADGYARGWRSVAFSADGLLLAGAHGKRIRLWDVAGRREIHEYDGHAGLVTSVAFTPDNKTIISGSEDGTAIVWDLARARDRARILDVPGDLEILKDRDFLIAYGAFCRLRAAPKETLKLLETHLAPAAKIPGDGFKQLMKDLDAANFAVRNRAVEQLKRYGVAAENALRKSREGKGTLETMRRIDDLLLLVEAEWPRSQWCVTLLEDLPEPRAHNLLALLAKGDPDCRLTRIAMAAVARLAKHSGKL